MSYKCPIVPHQGIGKGPFPECGQAQEFGIPAVYVDQQLQVPAKTIPLCWE